MATPTVELTHPSGSRATVHLFGATVTAFHAADEPARNVLFLSKHAALDGSKPIRGGVPLVFPIFGSAPGFPNHGLVRTSRKWTVSELRTSADAASPSVVTLTLDADEATRAVWPVDFALEYEVQLSAQSLVTALRVRNASADAMAFHALLHTYVAVDDVRNGGVAVEGLAGVRYTDKLTGASATETRAALTFDQETDSVYADAPDTLTVRMTRADGSGSQRVVTITKAAFTGDGAAQPSDAVVWNPWVAKAQGMSDFGDSEYCEMVCVEPGRVSAQQTLAPGDVYTLQQMITSSKL